MPSRPEVWWHAEEGRSGKDILRCLLQYLEPAGLVIARCLHPRISDRHRSAFHHHAGLETVFLLGGLTHGDQKFAGLLSDGALDAQHLAQVAVGAFIEGTQQADTWLDAEDAPLPSELGGRGFLHFGFIRSDFVSLR